MRTSHDCLGMLSSAAQQRSALWEIPWIMPFTWDQSLWSREKDAQGFGKSSPIQKVSQAFHTLKHTLTQNVQETGGSYLFSLKMDLNICCLWSVVLTGTHTVYLAYILNRKPISRVN